MLRKLIWIMSLSVAAVGLGLYVYPTRPAVVWVLLAFCWACFRLSLRARALFGNHDKP